jgi:hypothetical protein
MTRPVHGTNDHGTPRSLYLYGAMGFRAVSRRIAPGTAAQQRSTGQP